MKVKNKIYFASDFHLGAPNIEDSHKRERKIVNWLDEVKVDAYKIYLIGDIFDFWFEYKKVIPKGFTRILGKLAELCDEGIKIYLFTGNHDMWVKNYFTKEIGINTIHENSIINEQGMKLFIAHGDGLGNGDYFYKFLKIIFKSKFCVWLFSRLHPNFSFAIAHMWSKKSRDNNSLNNNDILIQFCKNQQKINPVDYYILGHNHNPEKIKLDSKCTYINTGDWLSHFSYAILFDGKIELKKYNN